MIYRFSEEEMETIWNNSVEGMAFVNKEGQFIKANPKFCVTLEYTESELTKTTFQNITHPADLYDDVQMSEDVSSGKIDHYIMSKRFITKTGEVLWCKLRVDQITNKKGDFIHFLSQISEPVVINHPEKGQLYKDENTSHKNMRGIGKFVRNNAKWLIPMILTGILTVIGGGYKAYHHYQGLVEKVNTLSSQSELK